MPSTLPKALFATAFLLRLGRQGVAASCSGTPTVCDSDDFGRTFCESISGCTFVDECDAYCCIGTATTCSWLSSETDCENSGCTWTSGGTGDSGGGGGSGGAGDDSGGNGGSGGDSGGSGSGGSGGDSGGVSGGGSGGDSGGNGGSPSGPYNCFSGETTVLVEGKGVVPMKKLMVGDKVLTTEEIYQPVYAFGHHDPHKIASFLQFFLANSEKALEVTGDHLIYLEGKPNPVRADSIQVGDALQGSLGAVVKNIQKTDLKAVYTPLTTDGTIVVNGGIEASSYISMQDSGTEFIQVNGVNMPLSQHDFVHAMLSPLRIMCIGVSTSFCALNQEGTPHYIAYGMAFIDWVDNIQSVFVKLLLLAIALVVCSIFMLMETVAGASTAPKIVLFIGTVYGWTRLKCVFFPAGKTKKL